MLRFAFCLQRYHLAAELFRALMCEEELNLSGFMVIGGLFVHLSRSVDNFLRDDKKWALEE